MAGNYHLLLIGAALFAGGLVLYYNGENPGDPFRGEDLGAAAAYTGIALMVGGVGLIGFWAYRSYA
jgi:hypothetical protein